MKKIFQIPVLFFVVAAYGQNITDYQYVKPQFIDLQNNKYGLSDLLNISLKQKNYTIIDDNAEALPTAVAQNLCEMITAEVTDTSNIFRNRLAINFKDCQNKTIKTVEGKSTMKEFEAGMRDAMQNALKSIAISNPTEKQISIAKLETVNLTPATKITENKIASTPQTLTKQVVPAPKVQATAENKAAVYSNGGRTLNKIILNDGEFILVSSDNSVPYATFKPSTRDGVYRVQLGDGNLTLGYMEGNSIVVEISNGNGGFQKEIFSPK